MSGQIETNKFVTAIKDKQAELSDAAAAGSGKLTEATAKVSELKTEMASLIPTLPEIPSIQGELSKLGSLDIGGLISKVGGLVTKFASAIPGLSDLMGSMGLSSFPPTIDISAITSKIPNVEEIDGKLVTQPAESKVAEAAPAAPVEKVVVEIDYDELSITLLKIAQTIAKGTILLHSRARWPAKKADRFAIRYIWSYANWTKVAEVAGTTVEELAKYKNIGNKESYDRYIAGYTGAAGYDVNLYHTNIQKNYNVIRDKHPESSDILDWTAVLKKWWEDVQKNK